MKQLPFIALAFGIGGLSLLASSQPDPNASSLEVRTIIDRALERAAWAEEQDFQSGFRHSMTQQTREFDGDGELTENEVRLYRVEPYRGVLFPKLLTKNGEPISGDDVTIEEKRWEAFEAALDNPAHEPEEDEFEMRFNEELIGRYTATLDGIQDLRDRPTFVLSFEPRSDKLPVRRRIDHALNKSRGEIWIDQETYEIARVSFQLMERVRLWWGILGSISEASGHFERRPVADDTWLATELDIYFQLRVLFSTTRRGETTQWSEFERLAD